MMLQSKKHWRRQFIRLDVWKIDRTKLKIKEDGSVEGLEDQVKSLKETYKDMFKTKTGKTPPEGDDPEKKPEDMSYEDFVNQLENGE